MTSPLRRRMSYVPAAAALNEGVIRKALAAFGASYAERHYWDPETWPEQLPAQEWVQLFGEYLADTHIVRMQDVPEARPTLRLIHGGSKGMLYRPPPPIDDLL
jgi:hypothetical protein